MREHDQPQLFAQLAVIAGARLFDSPEILERRLRKIPARRLGESEEIGTLACYLASPLSNFVTGAALVIDGGELSRL